MMRRAVSNLVTTGIRSHAAPRLCGGPRCPCGGRGCQGRCLGTAARGLSSAAGVKRDIIAEMTAGRPIIGDGGFVFELEKRGFVKAGPWTPEATCEFPNAVKQLHMEYARAGADVMQTFTFYASEDKLKNRGNEAAAKFGARKINQAACDLAHEVAKEFDGYCAGGIS